MKHNDHFTQHDIAEIVALMLEDGSRVKVIIDDGTATIPIGGYSSLIDSHLPDVIDGNSDALVYVADKAKEIQAYDENYDKHAMPVNDVSVYVFHMDGGRLAVTAYSGAALRRLLCEGISNE